MEEKNLLEVEELIVKINKLSIIVASVSHEIINSKDNIDEYIQYYKEKYNSSLVVLVCAINNKLFYEGDKGLVEILSNSNLCSIPFKTYNN